MEGDRNNDGISRNFERHFQKIIAKFVSKHYGNFVNPAVFKLTDEIFNSWVRVRKRRKKRVNTSIFSALPACSASRGSLAGWHFHPAGKALRIKKRSS